MKEEMKEGGWQENGPTARGQPRRHPAAPRRWTPAGGPLGLPGPETAVFGCQAPCAPIQKRHRKPIYIRKR